MGLLARELSVLVYAYLLAGIPIGGAFLAGRFSPLYRLERSILLRYWSWMALAIVLSAFVLALL